MNAFLTKQDPKVQAVVGRKGKSIQPLDAKRLGELLNAKNGLERNIPGQMFNGIVLKSAESFSRKKSVENGAVDGVPD